MEFVVVEVFLEFARRTYGDLSAPDFGLLNDTIERRPYASTVRKFADFCTIDDDEHNSWHDDVGLCDGAVQSMPMVRVFFTDLEDVFPFDG